MKYLLIFLISFFLFSPAYAAKTVTGSVPKVQPLQPAPAGVSPNFSHSVQSSAADYNGGQQAPQAANPVSGQNQTQNSSSSPAQGGKPSFLVLILIVVIGAIAFGWFWFKGKQT